MTTYLLQSFLKILLMVGFLFTVAAVLTWVDRRLSAMIQDRIGPNRASFKLFGQEFRLFGLLHTAADGLKFFFKEDFVPPGADKFLFNLAPLLVMIPVLALVAVIPFGDTLCLNEAWKVATVGSQGLSLASARSSIPMQIASLNMGILYVFALSGQGIVGAILAGWSSNNKFSLLGALRAASQMVSYEVTLGLSLVGAMMLYGTVRLDAMVRWQGEHTWGIFVQPFAFFLFFVAAVAESKRIPFDLPEAESELVSGYFTEYSGMKFGMFYFAEYMEIVTSSMLLVTIFLGGWQLPFVHRDGLTLALGDWVLVHQAVPHLLLVLLGVVAFFGKVLLLCLFQAFVRWSLPRFRYDQLMSLCWKTLLPLSLGNIVLTGGLALLAESASFSVGLRLLADLSQGALAALGLALGVWGVRGFFSSVRHSSRVFGSSARRAALLPSTLSSSL